jgi:hypothetical protein
VPLLLVCACDVYTAQHSARHGIDRAEALVVTRAGGCTLHAVARTVPYMHPARAALPLKTPPLELSIATGGHAPRRGPRDNAQLILGHVRETSNRTLLMATKRKRHAYDLELSAYLRAGTPLQNHVAHASTVHNRRTINTRPAQ